MATYWRSLLHSARAFGTQRPAALLLGTAAVSGGVWAAQVSGHSQQGAKWGWACVCDSCQGKEGTSQLRS